MKDYNHLGQSDTEFRIVISNTSRLRNVQSASNLSNFPDPGMPGRSQAGWAKLCSHLRPGCISAHRGLEQRENSRYNFLLQLVSPKSCLCLVVLKPLDQHSIRVKNPISTPTISSGKSRPNGKE